MDTIFLIFVKIHKIKILFFVAYQFLNIALLDIKKLVFVNKKKIHNYNLQFTIYILFCFISIIYKSVITIYNLQFIYYFVLY